MGRAAWMDINKARSSSSKGLRAVRQSGTRPAGSRHLSGQPRYLQPDVSHRPHHQGLGWHAGTGHAGALRPRHGEHAGRLRSGEIALDEHLINLLLACNDQLRDLLQGRTQPRAATDRDPADPGPALPVARAPDPAQPAADHAGSRTGQSDGSARLAPLPALYPTLYQDGFDLLAFIRYLGNLGRSASSSRSGRSGPRYNCSMPPSFLGYEIGLLSAEPAERIRSTFDFVARAVSSVCSAPSGSGAVFFQNRGKSWRPGAMSRSRPAAALGAGRCAERRGSGLHRAGRTDARRGKRRTGLAPPSSQPPAAGGPHTGQTRTAAGRGHYIRIEAAKLDRLINRVGELVIATSATTLQARMRGDAGSSNQWPSSTLWLKGSATTHSPCAWCPSTDLQPLPATGARTVPADRQGDQLQIRNADTDIDKSMVES